jgi:Zn-dependent peptidase ImmA (M78 family)
VHAGQPIVRRGADWERNELEHEADLFAAEILMPATLVEKATKSFDKDHHMDVEELARGFKVGRQEMEKRLRQLGLLRKEIPGRM